MKKSTNIFSTLAISKGILRTRIVKMCIDTENDMLTPNAKFFFKVSMTVRKHITNLTPPYPSSPSHTIMHEHRT